MAGHARTIDVHAHALPMPLLEYLAARGYADLSEADAGVVVIHPMISGAAKGARIPLPTEQYVAAERLAAMDAVQVDLQAVSAPPFVFASLAEDEDLVLDVTRRSNDALRDFVADSGGRLVALGTIPIGTSGGAAEAARCLDELGMAGLTVGTFGMGRELDDPVNEPVWELISERRAFCFVHPSRASAPSRMSDYYLVQLLGYPAETALAASRLIFGGVLDRYDPVLCLAHGGGCLAGVTPRLDLGWERKREARTVLNPPSSYLRRFLYDTAVFDSDTLRRLIEAVSADNVLLGTDAPFDLADVAAQETIRSLGLPSEAEEAILGGNARRRLVEASVPGFVPGSRLGGGHG
ncbi:hypothetical protein SRB5_46760 [Streptomyces sp. RB5]|uniref:Amidohydrolase-related domain-containing protein n=1 Tax=Streptomyces smaragdinus TaxID=2585196 RepID=A0A7K0CLZ2_9ACTN|nr:amidohydrolase family protein [Streptomyces smaragdinus]MQY14508.1 hypothetical protein [Streptomyces smaragdinus]